MTNADAYWPRHSIVEPIAKATSEIRNAAPTDILVGANLFAEVSESAKRLVTASSKGGGASFGGLMVGMIDLRPPALAPGIERC